ncbi:MAG: DUF3307 domain-containing protein [Anaerolineae bacterium]|nr:DUF3307 domain-containing protein [Anaerolineae bacterium]
MSLFDWLLLGHLIGDFLFQTDSMAKNKAQNWRWLLGHVSLYMVTITVILVAYGLSHLLPWWLLPAAWFFIFGTHLILDQRSFTARWMRLIGTSPQHPWLPIVADQIFHLITLAIVAQALVLAGGGTGI